MFKIYYSITKPGIIYGNLITVAAGFVLGTSASLDILLLLKTLIGISLIIASGCVLNNIIDTDIDALMERTRSRALVKGLVSVRHAYIFALFLGSLGAWFLGYFTNGTTLLTALFGLFAYVFIYSLWSKRTSVHGTLLGSISGAIPPVVGYTAAMGQIDAGAVILFLILTFWQMPHSYGVAMYRERDYANARIPVLPVTKGANTTKVHMVAYILLFIASLAALYFYDYAGKVYLFTMIPASIMWLILSISGFSTRDDKLFGKKMFLASIMIITLFALIVFADHFTHQ